MAPRRETPAGATPLGTLGLLRDRRFLPLFLTQLLGAFNDNLFKGAIVILAVYRAGGEGGAVMAMLAGGLFILPFLLFSALAGELADRLPKPLLIRRVKLLEILIMLLGAVALVTVHLPALLFVLFLMGAQSTLFGPLKYGILPELLEEDELLPANGLVEASTFLAILLGTMGGTLLVALPGGERHTALAVLLLAVLGWLASLAVPPLPAAAPGLARRFNPWPASREAIHHARRQPGIWRPILGISWFWAVGGIYLAQLPAYAAAELGAEESVATLLLGMFVLGIGLGSLLARPAAGGHVTLRPVPWAMAALALFSLDLVAAAATLERPAGPVDLGGFLALLGSWRLLADLGLLATAGGVFVVPLYAWLQARSEAAFKARVIAANNIVNAVFLVASAGLASLLLALGLSVLGLLLVTALGNLLVALWLFVRWQRGGLA